MSNLFWPYLSWKSAKRKYRSQNKRHETIFQITYSKNHYLRLTYEQTQMKTIHISEINTQKVLNIFSHIIGAVGGMENKHKIHCF